MPNKYKGLHKNFLRQGTLNFLNDITERKLTTPTDQNGYRAPFGKYERLFYQTDS